MTEPTAERWLPAVGHPDYEVSDHGRVRSIGRTVLGKDGRRLRFKGRPRRPVARGNGHLWITFPGQVNRSVHSLVLEAFVCPRPPGMWGCHADDDPTNNHLSNLRWAFPRDNHADMKRNRGHYRSNMTHCKRGHELMAPNLTASGARAGARICYACVSALGKVRSSGGGEADMQVMSDAYYRDIMAGNPPVSWSAKTHCPYSHRLAEPNIIASCRKRGRRACLACSRARSAQQKARLRGEEIDFQVVADARYAAIMADVDAA